MTPVCNHGPVSKAIITRSWKHDGLEGGIAQGTTMLAFSPNPRLPLVRLRISPFLTFAWSLCALFLASNLGRHPRDTSSSIHQQPTAFFLTLACHALCLSATAWCHARLNWLDPDFWTRRYCVCRLLKADLLAPQKRHPPGPDMFAFSSTSPISLMDGLSRTCWL
ncbi:hypothetical protein LX36DRAFT_67697 [Colletotrichum falcatum]|nr:hypothetical protein LX36DRAFT_67697 [Colletotrichum falcatum]